jgi:hypothetical protein
MPNYGLHKYGRFKYGKYVLSSGGDGEESHTLGPHVRYRIRTIPHNGRASEFLTMCEDRVSIRSKEVVRTRIRANGGEWITTQNEIINNDVAKVRIRSIEKDGGMTQWVYGDRGNLR